MTTIPRSVIIREYYRPNSGTAEQVALALTYFYRTRVNASTRALTQRDVERIWDEELEQNLVLRQLGDRPASGFPESDKVALCDRLMGAAAA